MIVLVGNVISEAVNILLICVVSIGIIYEIRLVRRMRHEQKDRGTA